VPRQFEGWRVPGLRTRMRDRLRVREPDKPMCGTSLAGKNALQPASRVRVWIRRGTTHTGTHAQRGVGHPSFHWGHQTPKPAALGTPCGCTASAGDVQGDHCGRTAPCHHRLPVGTQQARQQCDDTCADGGGALQPSQSDCTRPHSWRTRVCDASVQSARGQVFEASWREACHQARRHLL